MKNNSGSPFRKLNLVFITCIIGALVFYSVYLFYQSNQRVLEENKSSMTVLNQQMSRNIELIFDGIQTTGIIHIIDDDLNRLLLSEFNHLDGGIELAKDRLRTEQALETMVRSDTLYENISYVVEDAIVLQAVSKYTNVLTSYVEGKAILNEKGVNIYVTVPRESDNSTTKTFDVVKKVYGFSNYSVIGYVVVEVNFNTFTEQFDKVSVSEAVSDFFIYAKEGEVIYQSAEFEEGTVDELREITESKKLRSLSDDARGNSGYFGVIDTNKLFGSYMYVEETGWTIVQFRDRRMIAESSFKNLRVALLLFVLSILIITALAELVFQKQENRLEEYIGRTYLAEVRYKETELEMLQNQINPHFLYNTLNLIGGLAVLNDVDEIADITKLLSDMFRYNVKGGRVTSIANEVDQVEKYLMIQRYRHPEIFEYEMDVSEEIKGFETLKMILQPIVENAFEHSMNDIDWKGRLVIRGNKIGDSIILSVEDNGLGFDNERLEEIQTSLAKISSNVKTEHKGGLGIVNVHKRLNEHYGIGSGVSIESVQGEYTRIDLTMTLTTNGGLES